MKPTFSIGIARLVRPLHCGDWHDRPLRYVVVVGSNLATPLHTCTSYWATWREAKVWAANVRAADFDFQKASDLNRLTWK